MFCPSCGTQNVDTNKFCLKCGTALPTATPRPPISPPGPPSPPRNPLAFAATLGGIAGMAGGAAGMIGWLLPWFSAGFVGISGFQITMSAITGMFAGLQVFQYGGFVFVAIGLIIAIVYVVIPVRGALCVETGIRILGRRSSAHSEYQIGAELDRLKSR